MTLPSRAALLVTLATALSLLGDQTLYAVLPTYFEKLGLLPIQVGVLLSVNRWIRLLTNQLAERLARRYSPALLLALALTLGALLTAVYAKASLFIVLVAARMLWGLCWSFIRQIGVMTTVASTPAAQVGQAVGYYNGISRMGSLAGNFGGALLHDLIGFGAGLLTFAAVSLLGVPLGVWSQTGAQRHHDPSPRPGRPISGPNGAALIAVGVVLGCVGGRVMSTLGLVLKTEFGEQATAWRFVIPVATLTGAMLACRWIADTLGAPALGALTDRIGRQRGSLVFFGLGATALLAVPLSAGLAPTFGLVVLFFFCATTLTTAALAEAGSRGSRPFASYVTASDMGSAVGPLVGWTIQQFFFAPPSIFIVAGGLYVVGCLISLPAFSTPAKGDQQSTGERSEGH